MEDTKKLIEKYKQELMELSRCAKRENPAPARPPQIIGYIDNVDEETFHEATTNEPPMTESPTDNPDKCGDTPKAAVLPRLSAPEPRVESNPEFPYHHEPEAPPPDYTNQERISETPPRSSEQLPSFPTEPIPAPMPETAPTPSMQPRPAPMPEAAPSPSLQPQPTPEPPAPLMPQSTLSPSILPAPEAATTRQEEEYEPPFGNPQMAQNEPNSAQYPNLEQNGSQSQPRVFPQPQYSSFEDFQAKNTGRGTIIFRVTTAREALPVENAKCVITKKFGGIIREIDTLYTNISGNTAPRTLPAPPRSLSQEFDNLVQPFALYDAVITRDGFVDVVLTDIPVFDGVQSVQGVSMLPSVSDRTVENITEVKPNAE